MSGAEGVPLELLQGSPFDSYFIPGLFLFVFIGGSFLLASIAVFARWKMARTLSFAAVALVLAWLAIQVYLIGYISWMQPVTAVIALVILVLAWFYRSSPLSNYQRLVRLAEKVFDVKNDPDQLNVDQEIIRRLKEIHPSTVSEHSDGNGPVAWLLVIPTTAEVMGLFLAGKISEKTLYEMTRPGQVYEAIYLCSGLVLEEYRRKGISKKLAMEAIESIRKDHPIRALFSWAFTEEGDRAASKIAELTELPLLKRTQEHSK
jgi:GNAT superfamily N-acetyltransferase